MSTPNDSQQQSGERRLQRENVWPAFKTFAILFSFTVNMVLVIVLLIVGGWILFPAKTELAEPMLDDLQGAITALEEATILRTIPVDQQMPLSFTLPLNQPTVVVLSEVVELNEPAIFRLSDGGVIYGNVELDLPKDLPLPVRLNLDVPVDQSIPVLLDVQVAIPLKDTELNQVSGKLNALLGPIIDYINELPDGLCLLGFCIGSNDD